MASHGSKAGYQNFGSFMTEEHVQAMVVRAATAGYVGPQPPFPADDLLHGIDEQVALGKGCRHLFMIDFQHWTFINHGAFGAVSTPAYAEASRWREYCERQPLRFLDRELFPHTVRVMREVADFINASPEDLVLLPNATTGLNIVIRSCNLGPGDALYMLDIGYGSVKKMALAATALSPDAGVPEVVMGEVQFPIGGDDELLQLVARTMPAHTKLAVFDAVTSNTALVLPIAQLVQLCKSRGVAVLIDAAHALGQLPVDLRELDADYYVTNCHKWLAGPRGSALLWVRRDRQAGVRPLVVSHGSGSGFTSDFIWDGCRDYAPYLGLSAALKMWQALGVQRCRDYCTALLSSAVELLSSSWNTSTLAPLSMCANMALVGLPEGLAATSSTQDGGAVSMEAAPVTDSQTGSARPGASYSAPAAKTPETQAVVLTGAASSADAKMIQDSLHFQHQVECPIKCIQGVLFARISVQVYNDIEDYQKLNQAVLSMLGGVARAQ